MVIISLKNPQVPYPNDADGERVVDVLWAHLRTNSAIEHIRGKPGPDSIDLCLFLRGDANSVTLTDTLTEEIEQCLLNLPGWTAELYQEPSQ